MYSSRVDAKVTIEMMTGSPERRWCRYRGVTFIERVTYDEGLGKA